MTRLMRTAGCIPKATDTHSEYVTLVAYPLNNDYVEKYCRAEQATDDMAHAHCRLCTIGYTHTLRMLHLLLTHYNNDYVEKYCRAEQATDDMAHVHCRLCTKGYRHTLRICYTCCLSTTTMIMWKNIVERDRPQMKWRMCTAGCVPKATDTHSEYVTLVAYPLQQRLCGKIL